MSSDEFAYTSRTLPERRQIGTALLVLCTVIAYLPVINAGFIWDDDLLLTRNAQIQSAQGLGEIWLGKNSCDYTPLTLTVLWFEHALWGYTPTGYHLVNILLHAFAAVLLWRNLSILRIRGAWVAALLFAIHPVNVASVAWIAELKNTLSGVFFFASILAFLLWWKKTNENFYFGSLLLFALAGLSKGAVVTLPVVLCGCLLWMNKKVTRADLIRLLPFALIATTVGLLTVRYQSRAPDYQLFSFDLASRVARAGTTIWLYLSEIFWPIKLSPMFAQWQPNVRSAMAFLPTAICAGLLSILFWKRKNWGRAPIFVFGYFLLLLSPALGFVWMALQQQIACADWWQYLAAPGIFAGVAAGFCVISDRFRNARLPLFALLGFVLSFLLIQTWRRGEIYESAEAYCRAVLAETPHVWTLQTNLGIALERRGEFAEAIAHHRQSLRDNPKYMEAHNNLGNALRGLGNLREAESEFRTALQFNRANPVVLSNLADTCFALGKIGDALAADAEAIRFDRYNSKRYTAFGLKLAANKQFEQAIICFRNALVLAPNDAATERYLSRALTAGGRSKVEFRHERLP
jgi:Flp pilus assembly protein TadD